MDVAMSKSTKESEDEQTKRKKYEVDRFDYLPDDILLDILKRLPDDCLRYKAKYVCKRWFNISTNRILLDHASFILQKSGGLYTARHVDIREEPQGLETKHQYLDMSSCVMIIKSWYHEFLLITNRYRDKCLFIFNPLTQESSYLPNFHTSCGRHSTSRCGMALYFDRFKGVYKVVHLFMGPPMQCHILILESGINVSRVSSKWKEIEVPSFMECLYNPVSVQVQGRYLHWDVHSCNYLVSMDIVKENMFQMSLPIRFGDSKRIFYSIFEMGGFLCLVDGISRDKAEIWTLTDFERMKWEMLQSLTLPDHFLKRYPGTSFQYPVCGVISMRYVIFMKSKSRSGNAGMFSYDMKNGVVKELNIPTGSFYHCVVHSTAPGCI